MQAFKSEKKLNDLTLTQLITLQSICKAWACTMEEIDRKTDIIEIKGKEEGECIMSLKKYISNISPPEIITVSTVI